MKTLKSNRLHIGVFGRTNVGKSSLINKITGQEISIVSDIAGTTTDVVEKSMELLPIGSVVFLDTAGLDDKTELAEKRVEKTLKVLERTDIAVLVTEPNIFEVYEKELIKKFDELKIPYFTVINKCDTKQQNSKDNSEKLKIENNPSPEFVNSQSSLTNSSLSLKGRGEQCNITPLTVQTSVDDPHLIFKFKQALIKLLPEDFVNPPKIAGDLIPPKSTVILVVPIDKEAPKGRLILPQVQTIRDLLDSDCLVYTVKETELKQALENLKTPPALVITDSQAFKKVSEIVPENIPLTSFSILFARLKGNLSDFIKGANAIENLKDGDAVLILESCTHHAIEDDIGRVKIPNLLRKKTGKNLIIHNFAGHDFPDIEDYKLIIHCGACMTNRREILSRILLAQKAGVPITNYGIAISYCLGILPRATRVFADVFD